MNAKICIMKKHILPKLLISVLAAFLICSCSSNVPKKPVEPEPSSGEMENPESILDDFDYKPEKPIDFSDKAYYYNDHINDVKPSFKLAVSPNPELSEEKQNSAFNSFKFNYNSQISIVDTKGNALQLAFEEKDDNVLELAPSNEAYRPGGIYMANLLGDNMVFHGKSPDIKTLYFDVEREDTFDYELNEDLKYFNINKVVKFAPEEDVEMDPASEEAKEWFETHTYEMIYSNSDFSKLKEGDNFAVCPYKSGKPTIDDKTSFYGKFVSCTKVDNGYKVVYKNADLNEIYKGKDGKTHLDIYQNEKEVETFTDVKLKFKEEEFRDYLVNDPQFNRLAQALIIATGNEQNTTKYDVLTNLSVNADFAWNAPKFVAQVKISGYIPLNDDQTAVLYIEVMYQYTSTISAGGSVEVETFLGVPYWIEAKSEATEQITHKAGFKIAYMRHFQPDEKDTSNMKKMIKDAYNKLENDPAYFMPRDTDDYSTSGNERFFPLADINFPFGGAFSLFISLDIHLVLDLRVMFEYTYVNEHTQRILSFSTSDGVKNTANTDVVSCDCHTIDILGEFGVQLGLLIRAGLCITGLSKIFSMGFSVEGGLYLDLKGMVGVSWGSETGARFVGGASLDLGIYGKVSAFINFLFFHPTYDFAKGKLSFFGFRTPYSIIGLYAPDEITMTDKVYDLTNSTLLTAQTFDSGSMSVDILSFTLDQEVEVLHLDKKVKVNPLTVTSDSEYLEVKKDSNTLMITQYAPPSFDAHLTIEVSGDLTYFFDQGDKLKKEVTVHYRSQYAHKVSIKGLSDTFEIDKDRTFTLPDLQTDTTKGEKYSAKLKYDDHFNVVPDGKFVYDDTYYDFVGFTDGEKTYNPGTVITVKDKDIIITPILKVIVYHTATFYNGKDEVISVSRVREFTDAVAPSMEEIMNNMDGYVFYGWDRTFKCLSEDIKVYGIYYKVA